MPRDGALVLALGHSREYPKNAAFELWRTQMPKIEKNVPIPLRGSSRFPFTKLKVGDSFVVEVPKGKKAENTRVRGLALARRQGLTGKVTSRVAPDKKSVRFWRVK